LRRQPALDAYGTWSFVTAVRAVDAHTIDFELSRPFVPGLADLAQQPIVPAHVWRQIADPLTFTNPHPIATGPFTEVRVFRNQVYEVARNPRYWQPGKPAVEALRMVAYPSNDQANLALVEGEVDWGGNYVPAIERTFVERDRAHNGFWYPALGATVFLYPNHARAPFADVRVRRALSLAVDRRRIADVALAGHAHPSDATALTDAYATWRDPQLAADGWVRHDTVAAEKLLDEAGLVRGSDGWRRGRDGRRLTLAVEVVSGWSDWVRAAQLVARDLAAVGLDVKLRTYEYSAWFARLQSGDFDLSVGWSLDGPTPYHVYRGLMASSAVKPVGELAVANWHRFGDAGADELLRAFERTQDPARQRAIGVQLQARFVATAPAIPLFTNPLWGSFNTRRFVGFPNAADGYAKLSPHSDPERLLVLTSLEPRGR
jgi:peptide/nickel transport system substrate-binding protein